MTASKNKCGLWPCNSTIEYFWSAPWLDRSLHMNFSLMSIGCTSWKTRDNCPYSYSQWKLLRDCFWCMVKFPLFSEHKGVPSWYHCILMTDNPFWDEDTLQLRVTRLPHSAETLGLTSSTSSVDKDTNLYWELLETKASHCLFHILKRASLSAQSNCFSSHYQNITPWLWRVSFNNKLL